MSEGAPTETQTNPTASDPVAGEHSSTTLPGAHERLDVHDHVALLYSADQDRFEAVTPLVASGLDADQRCLYVPAVDTAPEIVAGVERAGRDLAGAYERGQFQVAPADFFTAAGSDEQAPALGALADQVTRATGEGYDALRVVVEMTDRWQSGHRPRHPAQFERRLDAFLADHDCLALCLYDYDRLDHDSVWQVLRTHRRLWYRHTLVENPHYVAPAATTDADGGRTEALLDSLVEREERQTRLRQSREGFDVCDRLLRHDVRNDLAVLIAYADEIAATGDDEHAEFADRIIETAWQIYDRSTAVRDVIAQFADDTAVEPRDVGAILQNELRQFEHHHPDVPVRLFDTLPSDVRVSATANLGVVFRELLQNTAGHSDDGVPAVRVTVRRPTSKTVEVRIADDNQRIPRQIRSLVTGDVTVDQLQHTGGIGLWLVNWIVTHSGGTLRLQERTPHGNVAVVRLQTPDIDAQ